VELVSIAKGGSVESSSAKTSAGMEGQSHPAGK